SRPVVPLAVTNVMGVLPDGTWTTVTGVGGSIAVAQSVSALQCSPASVVSGSTSACTVTLAQAAPTGGSPVTLSSNNVALTVPGSVTVPSGATTANFTAAAGTVSSNQTVTVTATLNGSATASVTVTPPPPAVSGVSCSPNLVVSGAIATCAVTLSR